jgi:predicted PurR-regulated permease PerM
MTDPRPAPDAAVDGAEVVAPSHPHRPVAARHYLWIAGAALVLFLALRYLGPVLTPFLVGAILAYLGKPLVAALAQRGIPRTAGTTLAVVLFGLLIAALFVVLIPLVQAEVALAMQRLPDLISRVSQTALPWVERNLGITLALDVMSIRAMIAENIETVRDLGLRVLAGVKSGGLFLLAILVNLALVPVVMFYLLRDWEMIAGRIDDLVPRRWETKVRQIAREIDDVLAEFLHGQLLVMAVLAIYYAFALWVVGVQHALAIGMLTGLLVFIPYVGFGLGLVLGIAAALLQWSGWPAFIAVLAVYGVGQLLENYVLIPYLVGDRIGLHPLAVIFALLAFGKLFGFAGVLLALPVSAALLVGLRQLRAAYVASPIYQDD